MRNQFGSRPWTDRCVDSGCPTAPGLELWTAVFQWKQLVCPMGGAPQCVQELGATGSLAVLGLRLAVMASLAQPRAR